MKEFLLQEFGTTKVSDVGLDALKAKLNGPALIERVGYRQKVGIVQKKEAIAKNQIVRRENKQASTLKESLKNPSFGFACLHYSVSEGAGSLKVKVLNKTNGAASVNIRTRDGDAMAGSDYVALPIDAQVNFKSGQKENEIIIKIIDDDEWEPDEDFYVELFDPQTQQRLPGDDTRCRITILDDDTPGMLQFNEKNIIRHPADEQELRVVIDRIRGTDGRISVKYQTVPMGLGEQQAKENVDYEPV